LGQLSPKNLGVALTFGRNFQDDFGNVIVSHLIYLLASIRDGNALGEEVGEKFLGDGAL
jgi:hypothetical protein